MTPQRPHPGNPPSGVHGVLSVLEELAAAADAGGDTSSEVPEHFEWVPGWVGPALARDDGVPPVVEVPRDLAERFEVVDAVRPQTDSLRVGLWFVAGTITVDGRRRRLFEPLLTLPVRIVGRSLGRTGDVELTPLVEDRHTRLQLELGLPWGREPADEEALAALARRIVTAAGLPDAPQVVPDRRPSTLRDHDGLQVVAGVGLYAIGTRPAFSAAAGLAEWQAQVGTRWTALHSLYLDHVPPPLPPAEDLPSAYALTRAQHTAVARSRSEPITVVAGAPGTGKTHTIAAIVGDAVARNQSVLVAAKADATMEALTELLERRPGPMPVVFGAGTRRWDLAQRLAAGGPEGVPREEVQRRWAAMGEARQERDRRWAEAAEVVAGLALLADGPERAALLAVLPGLGVPGVDLLAIEEALSAAGGERPGWWQLGRLRAWATLCGLLGVPDRPGPSTESLHELRQVVGTTRRLHGLEDRLACGVDWDGLAAAGEELALRTGEWMDAHARDERRLDRHARGVLGALATALRSGRAARRAKLATLTGDQMTRALPVWVGTLGDIDDLLPFRPALFDLVVLDEASSMDQPRAAAALLRGARAVVVGDPRQLRHVSFVPAEAVEQAVHAHLPAASPALRAKLDVRESSIFDVAAAGWPVLTLAEHFRSVPHLFAFVGERLYRGEVALATRTPLTDGQDVVGVTRIQGTRNDQKVVAAEVEWVVERLRELHEEGWSSVGVVSPFRAQADALQDAAISRLGRTVIRALGLRIGTVHAFQGMERDHVVVSLGIGEDEGPLTWRFAGDPHLFAVLATRARASMEVVHSANPPAGSLLAGWLAQVDQPPRAPTGLGPVDAWTRAVAEGVADTGTRVTGPYAVGHHQLDLCLHDAEGRYAGVFTRLHPEGPHAHVRRQVELIAAGWPLRLALPQVWEDQRGELALQLRTALRG